MFVLLGGSESLEDERCISCGIGKSIIFICVYGQDYIRWNWLKHVSTDGELLISNN